MVIYAFISVFIISLVSLIGVFTLVASPAKIKSISIFLVSFAVGGLFGDAFVHLLPESFEQLGISVSTSLYILGGILIFFILEKFLQWRHCHVPTSVNHPHPVATMNIIGDAVHNFIDGMLVGASFLVSLPIGISTSIAIILHEIPQEIGDFGILIHAGYSVKKALFFNFLSAIVAIFGVVFSIYLGPCIKNFGLVLMPITAGGFLYIAGSDLIPELKEESNLASSLLQLISIVLGIGIMVLLTLLE